MAFQEGKSKYEHIWMEGYDFRLFDYLANGIKIWSKYPLGFLFHIIISMIMIIVTVLILGMLMASSQSILMVLIAYIVIGVLTYSLFAGLYNGAHQISKGSGTDFGTLFSGLNDFGQISLIVTIQIFVLFVVSFIVGLMFTDAAGETWDLQSILDPNGPYLGDPLLFFSELPPTFWWRILAITGLYLFFIIVWQFSIPFVAIEKLKFWDALETSRKVITPHFFNFLLLAVVLYIGFMVGFILVTFLAAGIAVGTESPFLTFIIFLLGISMLTPIVFTTYYAAFEDIVLDRTQNVDDMIDSIGKRDDESA